MLTIVVTSSNGQDQTKSSGSITSPALTKQESAKIKKPENGFYCGHLDSKGNLWFGSRDSGVYSYDGTSFTHLSEDDGLCNNNVTSIIEDKEGDLWFGTVNGICRYTGKTFSLVPIPFSDTSSLWLDKVYPVLNPNEVHSLAQDKKGNIWIGTGGAGAYRYDGESFTSYLSEIGTKQEDSLYHNWIPSITVDAEGNIWFASMTHGGAMRYDGKEFTHFMPKDGLSDDMIRTIFVDRYGNVWFGFNGNRNSGLTYYNGKVFITFSKEDGLCNTNIRSIYEDKNGNLWLGSGRGGMCIYDGKSFTEFTTKEGHSFGNINFILEDANGNIWFGGQLGLWKFDGESVMEMYIP
jgi:ligand-binding sensor domain-containing protein